MRFSATQADSRVRSDMVNAGVALSPQLLESWGGCADGKEIIMLVLCETLPLRLLFCCKKIGAPLIEGLFLTCSMLCLNEQ